MVLNKICYFDRIICNLGKKVLKKLFIMVVNFWIPAVLWLTELDEQTENESGCKSFTLNSVRIT